MDIIKTDIPLPDKFPFAVIEPIIESSDQEYLCFHWHDCLEITYVESGKGIYYVNGQTFTMEAGDVILFNNIEPHAWQALPPAPMIQPVIVFHPSLIWSGSENLFDYEYLKPFLNSCTTFSNKLPSEHPVTCRIYNLLTQIHKEYNEQSSSYPLMIKAKLLEIMTLLIRHFQDSNKKPELLNKRAKKLQRLNQVLNYLKENFSDPVHLKEAASIACMNPNYFSTVFHDTLGMSFSEYLSKLRLSKAVDDIINTNKTITEIALHSGFGSMSNFYRTYQKFKGGSPSDLR